jgi:decaprenyl-phosphate phosphoribosyltransferase
MARSALYRKFNINPFQVTASVEEATETPLAPSELGAGELGAGERTLHAPTPLRPPAGPSARALLRACRPRQWSKNLLVLAAPCAAGVIGRPQIAAQVAGAFLVLCLLSSATYLVNDVRDREQDRRHPLKRSRPVAAGELSPRTALRLAALLALVGVAGASAITPGLGAVALGYLALTASYSLWLRRVVLADILAIAAGFVLRALAGGVATDIYLSRWFVIVTACCAIYLVAAKRYAELREHSASGPLRATLRHYSPGSLRLLLAATGAVAVVAYTGWAFTRPAHLAWYALSIVPLLGWLSRYAVLVGTGAGEAPEELILRDRVLLALGATWSVLFVGGVYVGN